LEEDSATWLQIKFKRKDLSTMFSSTRHGNLSFIGSLILLGITLIAMGFTWDAIRPTASAHDKENTQTSEVLIEQQPIRIIQEPANDAVVLSTPAKTGYPVSTSKDKPVDTVELVTQPDPLEMGYKDLMAHTSVSTKGQQALDSLGLTTSKEDTITLLAKLIASEAGPSKMDQLMVGSVVLNHVYSNEFPTIHSLIDAIIAPRHYACWPYMIKNRTPSAEMIASAKQVLSGQFPVPANIIFQAGFRQGTGGTFLVVDNKQYNRNLYNNYYCYNGSLEPIDRYGNRTKTDAELVALADDLHQQDIVEGVVSEEP